MIKRQSPTINQANILFFIIPVITLAGSAFFMPKLGMGTNLWINEFVYILFPPLLLARLNGWSVEDVYRFKNTSRRNKAIGFLSGLSLWFFSFYISKITRMFLDNGVGILTGQAQANPSIYQSFLILIGMIVLAPICEETLFRGFFQRAYDGYGKRYGFIITGIIFGAYHILNGISEVIPACILGVGMGYLVYKTDSISTSMLFHAAANTCAAFLGGIIESSTVAVVPLWLHAAAFAGLCISVVLLSCLKGESQSDDNKAQTQLSSKIPVTGIVFLALSFIFLAAVGVFEIMARLAS